MVCSQISGKIVFSFSPHRNDKCIRKHEMVIILFYDYKLSTRIDLIILQPMTMYNTACKLENKKPIALPYINNK
jgi:hypothetical protein